MDKFNENILTTCGPSQANNGSSLAFLTMSLSWFNPQLDPAWLIVISGSI